ncbi:MAG: MotA/TolQ/ExbB proton channel family protein [Planctomycetes bacterium]|nr:MotA/TolQ/ExbB proton channel family protein [Planctomycetota bacterium]
MELLDGFVLEYLPLILAQHSVDWWTMTKATGWCGVVQALLAVAAVALIIERFIAYHRESTHMESFIPAFEEYVRSGQTDQALELCRSETGHIPEVFAYAVEHRDDGMIAVRKSLAARIELQILPRLRRRMAALAVIAKTEPMLGLFGTVAGMIGAFIQIAQPGGNRDPGLLAENIGLALVTTYIGLVVAIPVIYFLTYFRSRVQQFELDLELYVQRCLELLSQ